MPAKQPKIHEAYSDIRGFMEDVKEQSLFNTRLSLLERDCQDFKNNEQIDDMIWDRIKIHQKNRDKIEKTAEKHSVNWTLIIQQAIAGAIIALVTAFLVTR